MLKYPNRSSYLVLKILLNEINLNIARKEKLLENVDSFPIDQKLQKFLEKENKEFSGLKNIEFVIKFHLVYSCSIDEAAFQFRLNAYQTNILKLLISKFYYLNDNVEEANMLYKSVIQSEYKTFETKCMLEDINNLKRERQLKKQVN